jgi:DNA invertase Pin-like site-specific DNA recombinase
VYARKSNEQRDVIEREKSVPWQIDEARRFVAQHQIGTIVEEWIIADDGISGADFTTRQLLALVRAAQSTPRPFDALVALDVDRIGREQIRTNAALLDLVEAGVTVYLHSDGGQPLRLDSPLAKMMLGFRSYAAEQYRADIAAKVRPKMRAKAGKGHVTGSRCYGYENVPVTVTLPDGKVQRDHVERRIRKDQAVVVRRIFQMTADGDGLGRIVRTLSAESVPPPHARRRGWAAETIRHLLRNEVYRGRIVYGRTSQSYRGGRRSYVPRDPSTWLYVDAEALRIVPEELWQATHAALAARAAIFTGRKPGGRLVGRPPGTRQSTPYLLSGLATCALCGGSILAYDPTRRRGRQATVYRCRYAARGATVCRNSLHVPMAAVDRPVLDAIADRVFTPAALDAYVEEAVRQWESERAPAAARRAARAVELRTVEAEIAGLERQLIDGAPWSLIAEPLTARRQRRDALRAEDARADEREQTADGLTGPALRAALADRVAKLRAAFAGPLDDPADVRADLMRLLNGQRMVFRPLAKGRGCEITGRVDVGALVTPVREIGSFGQGHHIRHWAEGGPTTLSNLTMLCRRHHRAVHEEATRSNDNRMASFSSAIRTGGSSLRSRLHPRCWATPSRYCERGMRRMAWFCTRGRRCQGGWASRWTLGMRST